jgi:DNA invertase Pin-like site-specific DNA recombinase
MQAVLYAAKSTKDPKGSITGQLKEGREKARAEDWGVAGEYSDEAASAWSGNRGPELIRAMDHAEREGATLIVQHSDRLARGALKAGVTIVSLQDPSTFENIVLAAVMGERNSEDSKRKSLATKAGLRARREKGLWGGGPRPYGYDYDKQSEMLVALKPEAVIVVRVFNEFSAGKSLSAIARALEADSVAPRHGRHWRSSTISQILSNPVYVGKMRHRNEVFDGVHTALVEQKLWDEVQVLLQARRKKGRGRPPKGNHLLRGGLLK